MKITISNDYVVYTDFNSLGYQGETNARTIDIDQPAVSGADTYRLRIEYADGVIYDVPIIDGKVAVTASMLRLVGTVECQWLATKAEEDSYDLVAKSNVFTLAIDESIGDGSEIPTPEIALSALEEISEKASQAAGSASEAFGYAEQAQTAASSVSDSVDQIEKNKQDIAEIHNDLSVWREGIEKGYNYSLKFDYSVGTFVSGSGENLDKSTRIRTDDFYHPSEAEQIPVTIVENGYQVYVGEYKYSSGNNLYVATGNTGFGEWITEDTVLDFDPQYYYKVMIRKGNDIAVEQPLDMADKIVFGTSSELKYIPGIIKDSISISANKEFPVDWEIGGMNGGDGSDVENTARIRTKEWVDFGELTSINIKWNTGELYIMKKSGTTPSVVSTWLQAQEYTLSLQKDCKYKFMYRYKGDADIKWANRIHFSYNTLLSPDDYHSMDKQDTKKMKVVTIGDSMFLYGNRGDFNSWQGIVKDYFGFDEMISVGIGGSGFVWDSTKLYDMPEGHTIGDNLPYDSGISTTASHNSAFCSWYRISNTIPKDTDLVLIGTGTNDYGTDDTQTDLSDMDFISGSQVDEDWVNSEYYSELGGDYDITKRRGAILSAIMKIQIQAPNAKIVLLNFPNTRLSDGTGKNSTSIQNIALQRPILEAMEYIHKWWGIPLIDVFGTSGINPLNRAKYTSDSIHCNVLGYSSMFANAVIAGLKPLLSNGVDY